MCILRGYFISMKWNCFLDFAHAYQFHIQRKDTEWGDNIGVLFFFLLWILSWKKCRSLAFTNEFNVSQIHFTGNIKRTFWDMIVSSIYLFIIIFFALILNVRNILSEIVIYGWWRQNWRLKSLLSRGPSTLCAQTDCLRPISINKTVTSSINNRKFPSSSSGVFHT